MKMSSLFFLFLFVGTSYAFETTELPIEYVKRYEQLDQETLLLPVDFAATAFLQPEVLQLLKNKRIHHVDLVYTAFRLSPRFDQQALNQCRIEKLRTALPQVVNDFPSWGLIEQVGAITVEEAQNYFHGFVFYFSEDLGYSELSSFLQVLQNSFALYTVHNEEAQILFHPSGTKIHIPSNAVVNALGQPVTGDYHLLYREFRNPAEIALTGIPMTYHEAGEEFRFNSAGMFEIRAEQNGESLFLKKNISVDFKTTQQIPDVGYYQLNEQNGEWTKEKELSIVSMPEVEFEKTKIAVAEEVLKLENGMPVILPHDASKKLYSWSVKSNAKNTNLEFEFNPNAWRCVHAALNENERLKKNLIAIHAKNQTVICSKKDSAKLELLIANAYNACHPKKTSIPVVSQVQKQNIDQMSLIQAGHYYPEIVQGLQVSGFGIYNCDQQFRIQQPITLQASFRDKKTKQSIENAYVACLIDLKVNGSFSFHPKHITCDPIGSNVLLLFTADRKIYMADENTFLQATTLDLLEPTFLMTEVTEKLKTPEDLQQLLHL